MNDPNFADLRCRNEGCSRPVERGEEYCSACCLDRLLYDREERRRQLSASSGRSSGETRG